jgi:Transmembrane secretion effector
MHGESAAASPAPRPVRGDLAWYLTGLGGWFLSYGLLIILFPWLVTVVLNEPPQRVGLAQMVLLAPSTLFLLLAGASADRSDGRALLLRYHLLALVPPAGLALAIATGRASYPVVLAYGAAMGTLSAFMTPARDALLSRLAGAGIARSIALASAAQYLFQLAGIAVAGLAGRAGPQTLLAVQLAVLAVAAAATWRLAPAAPPRGAAAEGRLAAIGDGLRIAAASDRIAPVMIIMAATGVLYVGSFFVVLPLAVRDVYGGGSGQLAVLSTAFWSGTIVATLAQVRIGLLRRPGRAFVSAGVVGGLALTGMSRPAPFATFAVLCFAWGLGAGVVMTQGRTIVQIAAPRSHRARVLALFQLGVLGGAPLGALAVGYLAGLVGPRRVTLFPAIAMWLVLAIVANRSRLWNQAALAEVPDSIDAERR